MGTPFPPKLKLHHNTPGWVGDGAVFHVRGRVELGSGENLIETGCGRALLESVRFYHERGRWFCHLFLLMPDHWHALLSFAREDAMSRVIGDWKRFQTARLRIKWQEGYFDHRVRNDHEFELKEGYIRKNPVVKGLCAKPEDWLWVIDAQGLGEITK